MSSLRTVDFTSEHKRSQRPTKPCINSSRLLCSVHWPFRVYRVWLQS